MGIYASKSKLYPVSSILPKTGIKRKTIQAYTTRGNHNDSLDTKNLLARTVSLRAEHANLLGYKLTPILSLNRIWRRIRQCIETSNELWIPAVKRALAEATDMQKMINNEGSHFKLQPWIGGYYAEKVKRRSILSMRRCFVLTLN